MFPSPTWKPPLRKRAVGGRTCVSVKKSEVHPRKQRKAGWGKDLIAQYIEDDESYEDFKEYM
jgi:hypothetical protein